MRIKYLFIVFLIAVSSFVFAKRSPPAEVPVVIHESVVYSVPHFDFENGSNQNGGFVRAANEVTNEVIWVKRIYKTWYNPFKEQDVQDVFITSMQLSADKKSLEIINERKQKYLLHIKTQKISK